MRGLTDETFNRAKVVLLARGALIIAVTYPGCRTCVCTRSMSVHDDVVTREKIRSPGQKGHERQKSSTNGAKICCAKCHAAQCCVIHAASRSFSVDRHVFFHQPVAAGWGLDLLALSFLVFARVKMVARRAWSLDFFPPPKKKRAAQKYFVSVFTLIKRRRRVYFGKVIQQPITSDVRMRCDWLISAGCAQLLSILFC